MSALPYTQFDYSLVRKKVTLYAVVNIGSAGACTLEQWTPPQAGIAGSYSDASTTAANAFSPTGTQGVASVAKQSTAGQYLFTFQGSYARILSTRVTPQVATTGISAAPDLGIIVASAGAASGIAGDPGTLTVQLSLNGVAANPASGEQLLFEFVCDDSSAI